ncbi:hypothetical protein [Tsuneonella litorea]|uniref:hypothetical protein n=1 Tax=Tsuneonella litorea TaxID=2976475 RepID=UPI0035CD0C5A
MPENRKHHLQPDVGHYGVFSGSKFYEAIYPAIRAFIENGKVSRRSVVAGSA